MAKCERTGCSGEDRYRGYCSTYCQDMHEVEQERDEARAKVDRLRHNARERGDMPAEIVEEAVARARAAPSPTRAWWYDHIHAIVIGAWRDAQAAHGDANENPSSVAKRVAAQLAEELTRGRE